MARLPATTAAILGCAVALVPLPLRAANPATGSDRIRIGATLPLSGSGAKVGEFYEQGYADNQQRSRLPSPARVAILWESSPNGRDYRKGLFDFVEKTAARRAAFSIVFDEGFDPNRIAEIGTSLARLKAASADVFLVDARLADSVEIHRRYLAAGLCHKVISYGSRGTEKDAAEALGKENVAYLVSSAPWNSQLGAKGLIKDFVDAFHGKYGRTPGRYEALAYEAARALFAAIEQAGSLDREQVREKLASLRIESILPGGLLSFPAAYGQQARYLFVVQQNLPDGRAPIVYPKIAATKEGIAPNPRCSH